MEKAGGIEGNKLFLASGAMLPPKPGTRLRPPWAEIGQLPSFALLCSFPSSNFDHFFPLLFFFSCFFSRWSLSNIVKSYPVVSLEKGHYETLIRIKREGNYGTIFLDTILVSIWVCAFILLSFLLP